MLSSCDFKNQLVGEVIIQSEWKREKTFTESDTQTSALRVKTSEVQTIVSCLQAVDKYDKGEGPEQRKTHQATLHGLQYVYSGVECDEERLANFLEGKQEAVLSILYKNSRSSAFDNYEPNWSKQSSDISAAYTLTSPHAVEGELHALGVSWNATGTMVAAAYGRMDTSGWCYNNGYVCVWNLVRPDFDENTPHYTLETDTYVTSLAFHPTNSLMLAVGTYGGEVIIYPNVTESVPTEHSSKDCHATHAEPITSIQWVQNLQEPREAFRYLLCCAGQDGLLSYWTPTNKLSHALALYKVTNKRHLSVGVAAVSHLRSGAPANKGPNVPSADSGVVVGLENGDVGRGRIGFISLEQGKDNKLTPVPLEMEWLDSHKGPVQSVSSSPFFRHLLLTCSSDGSTHLYHDLEREPLATLEPSAETKHFLYDAQFSPFRPSVLAMVSRSSFLHVYDLQKTQSKPVYSAAAGVDGAPVVSMSFNPQSPEWMVTGDARGCIRVWRLPSDVTQLTELERAAVRGEGRSSKEDKDKAVANDAVKELLGFAL